MLKKILQKMLKIVSKAILKKYKPKVVGITGSVGKTGVRDGVYAVLSSKYRTRKNIKNYNNEIGLPLTIIGCTSAGKDIFSWLWVFLRGLKLILLKDKNYPEALVLEMGVDRPGDMKYLTDIVKPDIGIVTMIGPSHLEFFGKIEKIKKEKTALIEGLDKKGFAIANFDNEMSREALTKSKARTLSYGFDAKADVRASELLFSFDKDRDGRQDEIIMKNLAGLSFKMTYQGSTVPVFLPDVLGYNSIYSALAGAAVGIAEGLNLVDIAGALKNLKSPKGRMNLIEGIKKTMIIDDTYNSSPQSAKSALDILAKIPIRKEARKIAVFGDMLELGSYSEKGHREVGAYAVKTGVKKIITIGERARDIGRGAEEAGMKKDDIFCFEESEEAGKFLQNRLREGDLVLVKGSQGIRCEKIVKEIMAEPMSAPSLLVRQEPEWN